ncbi:FolC bifunctional protein [Hortaea werneckii]|nr:FolC bifunctional protein [Hortaea werneckii]KAI7016885.1 FolC bifunctional protein [Hortaea werneckii]KAI7670869.1 FolC bifunctional protein [Hortaea werneckii]
MIELGLQRISRLLAHTSLPWRAIHVAGTNGKGSICAYTSAMLDVYNQSKYRGHTGQPALKHGRYTSPHLIDRWDCITINQKPVPWKLFHHIETQVKRRDQQEEIHASEFELLTATAFEIFSHENLDVAVVEVGMGGRLDATNILGEPLEASGTRLDLSRHARPRPLVTAIAKIGLDHQGFLGNTIEEIAKEKAGIMKPNVPAVWDESNDPAALRVLEQTAKDNKVMYCHLPEWIPDREALLESGASNPGCSSDVPKLPQHSQHNLDNAFRATWSALQQLDRVPAGAHHSSREQDILAELAEDMIKDAAGVTFAGRQQQIDLAPLIGRPTKILLDGAHNGQSAQALADCVDTQLRHSDQPPSPQPVTWTIAASDSKDTRELLAPLLKGGDRVFAVEFGDVDGMPWVKAMPAAQIVEAVRELAKERGEMIETHECGSRLLDAIRTATLHAGDHGPLVIAGSLYLVGDTMRLLREHQDSSTG